MTNLFSDIPDDLPAELSETLLDAKNVRIQRIVSYGHASPAGFWYDQQEQEWLVVLTGQAKLLLEGDEKPIDLKRGDCLFIAAHKKHRVEWTSPSEPTIWLTVFYK